MMTHVWATYTTPGFHEWSGAPRVVSFLKERHRHQFYFKVTVLVDHADREVEFFCLQKSLREFVDSSYHKKDFGCEFSGRSCEMIATEVFHHLSGNYQVVSVEVSEDNENGAIVYG